MAKTTQKKTPEAVAGPIAKAKKAKDFTKTAENLCNPPEVKALLDQLHEQQTAITELEGKIPPEIYGQMQVARDKITLLHTQIREAVEKHGSFQDVKAKHYAVKYRVTRTEYLAEPFKEHYPKFAPAVIIDAVNKEVIEQLVKGGTLKAAELKKNGIIIENISHSFYVR